MPQTVLAEIGEGEPVLTIQQLRRLNVALDRLTLEPGDRVALTGPSGSGKSLLLRAIADLDPNIATIALNGQERDQMPAPEWRARVGFVPAAPAWWTDIVANHFRTPPTPADLESVALPGEAASWPVARLSTGESVRLALLRALERHPDVLLLDEPTGPLDAVAAGAVEARLSSFLDNGGIVILTTHEPEQILRLNARTLRIETGGTVAEDIP